MSKNNQTYHITFIYPPATLSPKKHISAEFNYCLGSAYIIAYLKQAGFKAAQFLAFSPISIAKCVQQILAGKPKVVGFTVYNTNYTLCQLIAQRIKETAPGIIIVFGGPTASVQDRVVLGNNPFIDICVRNEGEETCLELLTHLDEVNYNLDKTQLEKIKGITFRIDNDLFSTPERNVLFENKKNPGYLDKYPSPYLDGLATSPRMGILTARGCNQNCVYCNCAVLSNRIIARHSVDRVIQELDYISKFLHQREIIDIFDDAFTLLPNRAKSICDGIIENKISLPLTCVTRCDYIDEELLEKIKEAGFKAVGFSLESAVPHVLRKIGKVQHPFTKNDPDFTKEKEFIEKFSRYVKYAHKIGIDVVYASVMVGLPGETKQEAEKTISLIKSLEKELHFYAHNVFQVYPGTPIFKNCRDYGLELEFFPNQVHFKMTHPFNTSVIPLAPNANLTLDGIDQDRQNLKTLSLAPILAAPDKSPEADCFENIILYADHISKEFVHWTQENLALNGHLIQVYQDLETAVKNHPQNEKNLSTCMAPTNYHAGYYMDTKKGKKRLVPLRLHYLGKKCGTPLDTIETAKALNQDDNSFDPLNTLVFEQTEKDGKLLFQELKKISLEEKGFSDLFDSPTYPHFTTLCRWANEKANCISLRTAIINDKNEIRICWEGSALASVGMSFKKILNKQINIRVEAQKQRNCSSCHKKALCTKCLFPNPLSEKKFCSLRRSCDCEKSVELIRHLGIFK